MDLLREEVQIEGWEIGAAHSDELAEICESLLLQKRNKLCTWICTAAPFRTRGLQRDRQAF